MSSQTDPPSSVCPSEDVFVLMLQQELSGEERAELEAHLDVCALCSQLVVELADLLSLHDVSTESFDSADALPGEENKPGPMQCEGYELLGVLGAGGMGVVYRARDVTLGREVAIKVIRSDALGSEHAEQLRARLAREARMLARVNHPNVVTIHEANVEAERIYLVMELVEGASLDRVLRTEALPWRQVVALYLQVCEGLAAAHRVGVVHRDIKPSNIIITPEQRAVLTDFGLARAAIEPLGEALGQTSLTRSGAILGTPAYMPPEQHLGGVADERSDIFSLCASLYASLYGERPFAGDRIEEVALNACSGEVRSPTEDRGVPRAMLDVLCRGMSRRKEDRFADVGALRDAIEEATRSEATRRATRSRVALLVASLLVAGSLVWWMTRSPEREVPSVEKVSVERVRTPRVMLDFSGVRAPVSEGVDVARIAAVSASSQQHVARSMVSAREVASTSAARAPRRHDRPKGKVEREEVSSSASSDSSRGEEDKEILARIGEAMNRSRRAFMNHDVKGCIGAFDGLPRENAGLRVFLAQCLAIDGRCDEGLKMYVEAFEEYAPGRGEAQLETEYRWLCSPPRSEELAHFVWSMTVFDMADLATCRTRGARLVSELERDGFRARLVEAGHAKKLVGGLHTGLACLGRSKKEECALATRISRLIVDLEKPGADAAHIDAKREEHFKYADSLATCLD